VQRNAAAPFNDLIGAGESEVGTSTSSVSAVFKLIAMLNLHG
jgi:hypothetical protein